MIFWRLEVSMPNLNPRVIGDLPYPNRSATTHMDLNIGEVTNIDINAPGSGYVVGEKLIIAAPTGTGGIQAEAEVTEVDGTGGITEITITNVGSGYTAVPAVTIVNATTQGSFDGVAVSTIVAITKGLIYTSDANGRLIVPIAVAGIAQLLNGIFQARASTTPGDGFTKVQVVTAPTRILLKANPFIQVNAKVDMLASGTTVTQDKVRDGANSFQAGYVGRVFEIETKNPDGSKKLVTDTDDLVVIDLGVSQ